MGDDGEIADETRIDHARLDDRAVHMRQAARKGADALFSRGKYSGRRD
jgi:hypothetical protein